MFDNSSSISKLPTNSTTVTATPDNIIDATNLFRTNSSTGFSSSTEKFEESVIEAKDFDIRAQVPIHVKKGEKVKFYIKRESLFIETTNQTGFGLFKSEPKEDKSYSETNQRLKDLEAQNKLLLEYVESLKSINSPSHDIIKENVKEVESNMNMDRTADFSFKALKIVTNTAISISGISALIFLFLFIFNVYMDKVDSMFAFALSFMTATMFFLDKIYRRAINHDR